VPDRDRERLAATSQERLLARFDDTARRPFALELA
jgi:hypothetical protein